MKEYPKIHLQDYLPPATLNDLRAKLSVIADNSEEIKNALKDIGYELMCLVNLLGRSQS